MYVLTDSQSSERIVLLTGRDEQHMREKMVDNPLTTNGGRAKLENLGAIRPSRQAVEVVAVPIGHVGLTTHW